MGIKFRDNPPPPPPGGGGGNEKPAPQVAVREKQLIGGGGAVSGGQFMQSLTPQPQTARKNVLDAARDSAARLNRGWDRAGAVGAMAAGAGEVARGAGNILDRVRKK